MQPTNSSNLPFTLKKTTISSTTSIGDDDRQEPRKNFQKVQYHPTNFCVYERTTNTSSPAYTAQLQLNLIATQEMYCTERLFKYANKCYHCYIY